MAEWARRDAATPRGMKRNLAHHSVAPVPLALRHLSGARLASSGGVGLRRCSFMSHLAHWLLGGRWDWGAVGWLLCSSSSSGLSSSFAFSSTCSFAGLSVSVDLGRWLGDDSSLSVDRLSARGVRGRLDGPACDWWLLGRGGKGVGGLGGCLASGVLVRLASLSSLGSTGCCSARLMALLSRCLASGLYTFFLWMPRLVFLRFLPASFRRGLCIGVASSSSSASAAESCWLGAASALAAPAVPFCVTTSIISSSESVTTSKSSFVASRMSASGCCGSSLLLVCGSSAAVGAFVLLIMSGHRCASSGSSVLQISRPHWWFQFLPKVALCSGCRLASLCCFWCSSASWVGLAYCDGG